MASPNSKPNIILIFSGKRKSGKDYVTDLLRHRLGTDRCAILRLSGPLKGQYAKDHNLDIEQLLDATEYKEKYRADMIQWGEAMRNKDPGYFGRLATSGPGSELPIWIISDARRKTDVAWFNENFPDLVVTIRVRADDIVRAQRGWIFTKGVDDADSECGLDSGVCFDHVIVNNGHGEELEADLAHVEQIANERMK